MADVFLSYASEDRPRVEPLANALEAAGLSVWWDRRIGTGSSFDVVIERELDAAGCVVVVWSKQSIASEWVRNEATEGAERGVLVPVQIDDVRPPLAFRRRQTAQLHGWPDGSHGESLSEVLAGIRQFVDSGSSAAAPDSRSKIERSPIVVAVLPLSDRTAERNMAYLCEGLAEDLMNALFPFDGLRVLSATDTFAFGESRAPTREIGRSLGATVVLEGSVQRDGERIAIAVRLVDVTDGITLYSERFQRDTNDVFEVQAEIASRVVVGLRAKLGLVGNEVLTVDSRMRNPVAHRMYKALNDGSDLGESVAAGAAANLRHVVVLECAIALDPSFERAYFDLVRYYPATGVPQAAAHAKRHAVLDQLRSRCPNSPLIWETHAELEPDMKALASSCHAMIARGERVYPYAHPTGLRDVRGFYAQALAHAGLHREAIAYYALIDRPAEPGYYWDLLHTCGCLVACRAFERAIELCRFVYTLSPNAFEVAATCRLIAHLALDDLRGALAAPPDRSAWHDDFAIPLLQAKQHGTRIDDPPAGAAAFPRELRAYALLAADDVERGVDHLVDAIADAGPELHWIGFRLPFFSVLFSDHAKRHPTYRKALAMAHLDDASREPIRTQAATLTPITGVEVGPLLRL